MSRAAWSAAAVVAIATAASGGYLAARSDLWPHVTKGSGMVMPPANPARGPVIYFRDPDGPHYSLTPTKTLDGREYRPVRRSEDISFETDEVEPEVAQAAGARKVRFYRNPMGLPDTSPVPKKDSMGMDYLPVYEGDEDDAGVITVSPGKIQRTGVRSEVAEKRVIARAIRVPATIQLDERRVSVVSTRSDAFIDKVENITTGDRVKMGQPLVRLFSPEINAAAAQLIAAIGYEGSRRRLKNLNVPDAVVAEIERTRTVPQAIQWTAPRDGIVLERNAVDGMRAASGDVLFRIADISTVWAIADVPEHVLDGVRTGEPVRLRLRSMGERTFSGRISVIYPQVSMDTRTTRVRIELPNMDGTLRPGMYAEAEIATGSRTPVVAVPDNAVIDNGTRRVVLVDKGQGRFEPREVDTGAQGNGYVEIKRGIAEGETVVTSANFLIDAESNLKAALRTMSTPSDTVAGAKP